MKQTKITVKIHTPLLASFNRDIDRLFIKRDAFLNQVLAVETQYLAEELAGKRLSPKAKRFIAGELKRLGTTTVNIVVDQEVADELNAAVEQTNIVRDAFINRLLWLLRGGESLLEYLDLPKFINGSEFERFVPDAMPTAPLQAMHAVQSDPLHYLRTGSEERHDCGLYALDLPRQLWGFACWLDDFVVPGTATYLNPNKLLEELMSMESEAFENFVPTKIEKREQE